MWKKTQRAWGYYRILVNLPFFKIKWLRFDRYSQLSMQKHFFRNEFWIIFGFGTGFVKGKIHNNPKVLFIKKGLWHRYWAHENVKIIEFQFGSKVVELDIERL